MAKNTSCIIQGDYKGSEVRIAGSEHIPPKLTDVPKLLERLFAEFYKEKRHCTP